MKLDIAPLIEFLAVWGSAILYLHVDGIRKAYDVDLTIVSHPKHVLQLWSTYVYGGRVALMNQGRLRGLRNTLWYEYYKYSKLLCSRYFRAGRYILAQYHCRSNLSMGFWTSNFLESPSKAWLEKLSCNPVIGDGSSTLHTYMLIDFENYIQYIGAASPPAPPPLPPPPPPTTMTTADAHALFRTAMRSFCGLKTYRLLVDWMHGCL